MDDFRKYLPHDKTGIKLWKNEKNGFCCLELHYTCDPDKRAPAWKSEASKGIPKHEWSREYELCWTTFGGKPVYGEEFNSRTNVLQDRIYAEAGFPIFRGWDFGFNQSCVFAQLIGRKLYILDEIITENMGSIRFVPIVLEHSAKNFGDFEFIDVVDPAGFTPSESTETACVDVMVQHNLRPVAGPVAFEERRNAVLSFLSENDKGSPCLLVNPSCHMIIGGFAGGYQYPEKLTPRSIQRIDRPLKNEFSHPHDCLQYIAAICKKWRRTPRFQPSDQGGDSIPNYSFVGD